MCKFSTAHCMWLPAKSNAKVRFFITKIHIVLVFFTNICFFSEKLVVKSSFFTTFASFLYKITEKKEKYIHK